MRSRHSSPASTMSPPSPISIWRSLPRRRGAGRTAEGRNRTRQDQRSVRRLSGRAIFGRGQDGFDLSGFSGRPACPWPPARRFSRARASAGVPPARRGACCHAVTAGCRLVDHRIVTLSQLVAFLSFQVRAVSGLRTLGASLGTNASRCGQSQLREKIMVISHRSRRQPRTGRLHPG